jgi:hypothetical protein
MTRAERFLYHQIHPVKLLTDVATSFASTWLLWEGRWAAAAVVAFVPSIVVTALVLWLADLERLARTPLGRYVAVVMTGRVTAVRSAGQIVMWVGAAAHVVWLIPLGFLVIVYAWLSGYWRPSLLDAG